MPPPLGALTDVVVVSVHAVTEDGLLAVASASGSQLAPYAAAAKQLLWVVGTRKVVADLDTAHRLDTTALMSPLSMDIGRVTALLDPRCAEFPIIQLERDGERYGSGLAGQVSGRSSWPAARSPFTTRTASDRG